MYENRPQKHEFEIAEVQIKLSDIQEDILQSYIHEVMNSYSAAELISEIEPHKKNETPEIYPNGFKAEHSDYMVKGSLVGLFNPVKIPGSNVRYNPATDDWDCPSLVLGPVHRENGKTVIVFQGLHFQPSDADDALDGLAEYYKTYAFIYDPKDPKQSYRCLAADSNDPFSEFEIFYELTSKACDMLIAGDQI